MTPSGSRVSVVPWVEESIGLEVNDQPRVQLQLNHRQSPCRVGTQVVIGANGLLGARYVQLDFRGEPPAAAERRDDR